MSRPFPFGALVPRRALDGCSRLDAAAIGRRACGISTAAIFIVIYDPPAADDLVRVLSGHGFRARKRTPFVVQVDGPASEATVERLFACWRETHGDIAAELITASRLENLTVV